MSIYYGNPNGMLQALDIMAAQATVRSHHRASARPAQSCRRVPRTAARSRWQPKFLLLVGLTVVVLLLVAAAGRI